MNPAFLFGRGHIFCIYYLLFHFWCRDLLREYQLSNVLLFYVLICKLLFSYHYWLTNEGHEGYQLLPTVELLL